MKKPRKAQLVKKGAKSHVDNPLPHPAKSAPVPDVPVHAAPATPSAAAPGVAVKSRTAMDRQLAYRFPQWMESVRTMLRQDGVRRPPKRSLRKVGRHVAAWLGDRRIAGLDDRQLAELASALRRYYVVESAGFKDFVTRARKRARTMTGAVSKGVTTTTVDTPEGVWVFASTGSVDPVIVEEAFVPRIAGAQPPKSRPPYPAKTGRPRWLLADGSLTYAEPTIPLHPERAPTGPAPGILEKAPGILIEQLMRAERRRSGAAWVPLTSKLVKFGRNVDSRLRRTLGLGIDSMEIYRPTQSSGQAYDTLVVIKGRTGRAPERVPDADVLPQVSEVFGENAPEKWARLHAWGPILGDSTPAGLAYGPVELNKLQRDTIEKYLNEWKSVELEVSVYLSHRKVDGSTYPFVRTVKYRWATSDGNIAQVALALDKDGKVLPPDVEFVTTP
ncbi:MAG: hypothetical protein CYG60_05035 [Actinobacteria bacterium]|nr:MAG: hypothetical protein CYG60_05035 [Actinomycetota bacterium]